MQKFPVHQLKADTLVRLRDGQLAKVVNNKNRQAGAIMRCILVFGTDNDLYDEAGDNYVDYIVAAFVNPATGNPATWRRNGPNDYSYGLDGMWLDVELSDRQQRLLEVAHGSIG